jgi:hypothetical protein
MKQHNLSACLLSLYVIFFSYNFVSAQTAVRTEIDIPDILNYKTLVCDFHMHTVFSDGNVWPTIRVQEAWREGLHALSITDHLEYLPHKDDVKPDHNRSFEIARPAADAAHLTIIRGAEITRDMPPGHFNAIFLKDAALLRKDLWRDAFKAAVDQQAFIFWNHPGWRGQQPDGVARWYEEHTELFEKGWLHGIEVVNEKEYYPEAHRWCLEKDLTMLGNSDIHAPIQMEYEFHKGEHRPMTLVFAQENSEEALKEALFAGRTAVYFGNTLIGKATYLKPIFDRSIEIEINDIRITGKGSAYIGIHNHSQIDFELVADGKNDNLSYPDQLTLWGGRTTLCSISAKSDQIRGQREETLNFTVKNLKITPEGGLPVALKLQVNYH